MSRNARSMVSSPGFYFRTTGGRKRPQNGHFFPYNPRLFAVCGVLPDGGDSIAARRREQAPVLPLRRRGLAPRRLGQVPRARRLLRPEGTGRTRSAAREPRAGEALAGSRRAAFVDRQAPREAVCQEGCLID